MQRFPHRRHGETAALVGGWRGESSRSPSWLLVRLALRRSRGRRLALLVACWSVLLFSGDTNQLSLSTPALAMAQGLPIPQAQAFSLSPSADRLPTSHMPAQARCGEGMLLIEGDYCPKVQHRCRDWLDDERLPYARCRHYAQPAKCLGTRAKLQFCIDRDEWTRPSERLPENHLSLNLLKQRCESVGKRLCLESEWNFACEGEEMRPYPYGWSREPKCNQDREDLAETRRGRQILLDLRSSNDEFPDCLSPFGVHNMVGNLDEAVLREGKSVAPTATALKGGWWMAARNRCRPATTAHDADYEDVQVGGRCCADVADSR